ncbi:MAG: phosphatidylserine decarboxylase [Rhizomicrobium sp.]
MRSPIHREGWPFIAIFVAVNALLFWLWLWAGLAFLVLTVWCVAFFRDPERAPPPGELRIVSPADGKLLPIVEAPPPPELGLGPAPRRRLSIFMDVFNVHVNRMPLSGTVIALAYRPGKFLNASFDKASEHNERMAARLRPEGASDPDSDIAVVQIAGLVARRIVCDVKQGDAVRRGARYGMIRFGSRLDVYLPSSAKIVIQDGSVTRAGETVLAELQG